MTDTKKFNCRQGEIKNHVHENEAALTAAVKAITGAIFIDCNCNISLMKNFINQHRQLLRISKLQNDAKDKNNFASQQAAHQAKFT